MAPASVYFGFQSFTLLPTIKLGPCGAGSWVGGLVHTLGPCGSLQWPLLWGWESLLLLPPTPTGVFNHRSEALFPHAGALGYMVCFAPRRLSRLSVHECGATGSDSGQTACPVVPHCASLSPAMATWVLSAPVPISAPPTGLDECLFFISLVSDFLAVRFSVSSGCAKTRSVSTYAAILVLQVRFFKARNLPFSFFFLSLMGSHCRIFIWGIEWYF